MMLRQPDNLPVRRSDTVPVAFTPEATPQVEPDEIDLHGHLAMLYRRRKLILTVMASVFILGMLYTLVRRPVYESTAKILVFTEKRGETSLGEDLLAIRNLEAITGSRSIDTQIEIISSPDLLENAFHKLSPSTRSSGFASDAIPGWACKIWQAKDADVIAVTGRAYTPNAAADLAKAITTEYLSQDLKQSNQATRQARIYAEGKMAIAERELAKANMALSQFKRESGLFAPETQVMKHAEHMAELSTSIDATRAEIAAGRQENVALLKRISAEKKDVLTNTTVTLNPQFTAALDRIDKLQSERSALLQEYTPGSRNIKEIEDRIKKEEDRLKQIAATVVGSRINARNPIRDTLLTQYSAGVAALAADSARLRSLEAEAQAQERAARKLPDQERELTEHMQRVSMLQRTYEMLSTKYHTLMLSEQAMLPSGTLVATPRISKVPAYPKTGSNAVLFLLLGAFVALVATMIAERLDMRVHDPNLVEQISGAPALSVVPEMLGESPRLFNGSAGKPALLESFRILRNNISFAGLAHGLKVIAVTSPGRGEGKSTTVANLAVTMAMEGNRVLLVDGDMHNPSLHKFMAISGKVGLSNVLEGVKNPEEAIQATSVENVYCLPAGSVSTNAAELLGSKASRDLFEVLREWYDVILIDCPPAVGMSDAQVISTLADGVLLVVSISHTMKPHLDNTIRMLNYTGVPLVGLVINRMNYNPRDYGYYYGNNSDRETV